MWYPQCGISNQHQSINRRLQQAHSIPLTGRAIKPQRQVHRLQQAKNSKKIFRVRKKVVRLWPDRPDRQLRPCTESYLSSDTKSVNCECSNYLELTVASRSQRVSLIVIPFCLSGCLSVIPRPTAYHDWSITTKFGRQVYTCPRTRVSLFGSPVSHTFGARGKNMQNFTYFQRIFLPLRTWHIVPYDLSLCDRHDREYCKNGWTNRDAVWEADLYVLNGDSYRGNMVNAIER